MSLSLGKSLNRCFKIRINFLNGYYNIDTFFNKKSTFLLFGITPDFKLDYNSNGIKINMFRNIYSSKFCETFLKTYNYKNKNLDILNQYEGIKNEYEEMISYLFNETIILSRSKILDKYIYDSLSLYGLTLNGYNNEFIFMLAERQSINKNLNLKMVRTSAIQISTSNSYKFLESFYNTNPK